jgi:hypothetical protein
MRQRQLGIVKRPVSGEGHQAALMGHLQEPCKLHEGLALDQYHVLRWDTLWCLDGLSLHWCWRRRGSRLATGGTMARTIVLALYEGCGALVQANGDAVFAPATRVFGVVLTGALAIDHVVHDLAIALTGDSGGSVLARLDIARQHQFHCRIYTAVTLREGLLGLLSDLGDRFPPGGPGCVFTGGLRPGIAFPVVTCYHSHHSMPLAEGLGEEAGGHLFQGSHSPFLLPKT